MSILDGPASALLEPFRAVRMTNNLHVPLSPARPGEAPDFTYLRMTPPGVLVRPDPTVPATETLPLATGLVSVLSGEHRAVGPWDPRLDPQTLLAGLRFMLLTRA